ncbi:MULTISPECIES: phosphonate C-P lyase system protein PhnG [unclassified Pseudodesulfovibrio]|uniref:phosphonate C-P lyase system protein PhnG n=1 Tax=unclassified Pseudodesulfovibrio TaxID=2661612 RepID=UPI000FEBEEF0|nr:MULTISPECIES: phosphonate C-P lyase system protein PhnG [unclassified Pseudodesulfovibrio]MCJ2165283.1 phosphonate C-P lyase system protein PhnG [Pseudodesulfovibrio sp. S3-i]RWU03334.1 phosphonate C-P lyase system protein PhnG [Pseudodesulfovibrio sp. S3]
MKPDSDTKDPMHPQTRDRKNWMGVLSRTGTDRLEALLADLGPVLTFEHLRPPEVGMAMVRARTEARGGQFNLGEMTVSRCSVRLEDGNVGHGYVIGRDKRHAELAAVFDALLQHPEHGPSIRETIITPLACELSRKQKEHAAKTAATRVNFFTMARGED